MNKKSAILLLFSFLYAGAAVFAQTSRDISGESTSCYPVQENMKRTVEYLSSKALQGRGKGTLGHSEAALFIAGKFRDASLMRICGGYGQSFTYGQDMSCGHNIIGMLPGRSGSAGGKYTIIGTHYDHLGTIDGIVYPGADANASGVEAMLELVRMFKARRDEGVNYGGNVIFVAFDANLEEYQGAAAFWNALSSGHFTDPVTGRSITPDKISLMVDLDQLGSSRAPVHKKRKDYMIVLGEDRLPKAKQGILGKCNTLYGCNLDLCYSYYNSEAFTKMFYRLGDRRHFIDNGIPTMMFSSGITDLNNKHRDNYRMLDYEVFRNRIILIFRYLEKII